MASGKSKGRQAPKLTKNQRELKALKSAGLWSGDWRRAKVPSGAQKRLRYKFRDVIGGLESGAVRTVKVPRSVKRGDVAADLKLTRGRILVNAQKGERLHYNPKTKMVTSTLNRYGVTYRRLIYTPRSTTLENLPKGKNYRYQVPLRQWGISSPMFSSPEELAKFMAGYEEKKKVNGKVYPGFPDWLDYVEVLELVKKVPKEAEKLSDEDDD